MAIKRYVLENGITIKQFALDLGYTPHHIYMISLGYIYPSDDLAKAIEVYTKGQIKAADLLKGRVIRKRGPKTKVKDVK